ncbi:hypothetical protein TrVE_jg12114 [Triparma verrucosa]|uniref:DUF1664 domain-containing protein n=2 Tax=Triparma TaxID=722752 RepID=A0A9W7B9W0_9STRA|nr:hypothetical protein TrST_g11228 [Triparma strigata]GMI01535.1 hypothetical protein TrVE_jg12114 [Triparma verrucosa]
MAAQQTLSKLAGGTALGVLGSCSLLGVAPTELFSLGLRSGMSVGGAGSPDGTLTLLSRRVDELQRAMAASARNQGSTIVVHGNGDGVSKLPSLATVSIVCIATAAGYAWMRFRGLSFDDVMVVTTKTFNEGLDIVGKSLESVSEQVKKVHDKLSGQVQEVDDKVKGVDEKVERNLEQSRVIKFELDEVLERLKDGDDRQDYIQRGIHLLCSVVGEAVGTNSVMGRKLLTFSKEKGMGGPDDAIGNGDSFQISSPMSEIDDDEDTVVSEVSYNLVGNESVDGRLRAIQRLAEGLKGWVEPGPVTPSPVKRRSGGRAGRSRSPVPSLVNRATYGTHID